MGKKIFKWFILLLVLIGIIFAIILAYNYIKPMLVTGKIVELEGEIKLIDDDYILIIDKDNNKYKCYLAETIYYQNGYIPTLKDKVVAIYDYDETVIEKNKLLEVKEVTIKRIYKER